MRLVWLLSLLFCFLATSVQAATGVCDFATGQGVNGPPDFATYCWIDFSNYNSAMATSPGGQNFTIDLPGSATLSFNLKVSGSLVPAAAPVWSGAAFGQSAFLGVPGTPSLYQTNIGATTSVTLSNITVTATAGELPYTFVAADPESTNNGEYLEFQTSSNAWTILAQMQNGSSSLYPTLNWSNGNKTVREVGVAGTVGAYAFASNFPASQTIGTVTGIMQGGGLQAVLFGIKYHAADLTISATHSPASFVPGSNGSYTLTVHNNGPDLSNYSGNFTTTVTDTLPAGLTFQSASGSGWSCGASGQLVTCTSSAAIASGNNFPPITINASVSSNAASLPASVANSASVSNDLDYDATNNTVNEPTPIVHSSLVTSSKTVTDLNGGDAQQGDLLQYTITLAESNGLAATGVSVLDNMDTEIAVGSLNVTSTPAGSTDSSNPTGGSNGSGQVNISNITVPANGSVSIVYQVQISGSATNGQSIDNTATVTNPDPNGTGANPSVSVTINQSQTPASGNKILYFLNLSGIDVLSRTPTTATGPDVTINDGAVHGWFLTPVLQKDLTLQASSTVSVVALVECARKTGGGNCRSRNRLDWVARIFDYDGSTFTPIGSPSPTASFNQPSFAPVTANIPVGGTSYTLVAGHRLVLGIYNTTNPNREMLVRDFNGGSARSRVNLSTSTVINVDSVIAYSAAYPSTAQASHYTPGATVYIRAVVSDPFGSYDIDPATGGVAPTVTIKDANGTTQLTATNMPQVNDSGAATKTFEYAYTVPPVSPSTGFWSASVTATEGYAAIDALYNGGSNITHTASGSFEVQAPDPVLMKSVQVLSDPTGSGTPHALPGALLQYSINVSNQGQGTADANSIKLTDTLDASVAFIVGSSVFVDGSPASGLSFNQATDVSFCTGPGGATCPYTSGVGNGNPDPNITKVIFTPSGTLNGKANATAPAPDFTIQYQVELQ